MADAGSGEFDHRRLISSLGAEQRRALTTLADGPGLRQLAVHLGLQWVYDTDLPPVSLAKSQSKPGAIQAPAPAHLQDLIALGEIGYIRGIEAKLDSLAAEPENLAFTEEARRFVRAFDLAGYADYLQAFDRKDGHG